MKRAFVIVGIALAAAGSTACAASRPDPAAAPTRALDRHAAIARAREDAWATYRELQVAETDAQLVGSYWIVELRSATGGGLRYAISSHDGSIRERAMIE